MAHREIRAADRLPPGARCFVDELYEVFGLGPDEKICKEYRRGEDGKVVAGRAFIVAEDGTERPLPPHPWEEWGPESPRRLDCTACHVSPLIGTSTALRHCTPSEHCLRTRLTGVAPR